MEKVYVYIKDIANDYDDDLFVELYASKNDAIAQLTKDRNDVIDYWKENGVIACDSGISFSACEDGFYARNHDHFYIVERIIN